MGNKTLIRMLIFAAALAAAAGAADTATFGRDALGPPAREDSSPNDIELKWDNGQWKYFVAWNTGLNSWVGNDFTAASNFRIKKFKYFSTTVWPNTTWDGFRVAVYEYVGGQPGEMLWPTSSTGKEFTPSGLSGHVWVEIPINWVTPAVAFVAAVEQVREPTNCDPFAVDSNGTDRRHSWSRYAGRDWRRLQSTADPYRNAMLRVVGALEAAPGVTPATLGRVKALYF